MSKLTITTSLIYNVEKWFESQLTADQMKHEFDSWLQSNAYTSTGKPKEGKIFTSNLITLFIGAKEQAMKRFCVFGYEYQGEFYTTHKNAHKLKTTETLLNLNLSQDDWDSLPRGQYYADSLKKHY